MVPIGKVLASPVQMKTNVRSMLIWLFAVVVILALIRQESEIRHLRRMVAEQIRPAEAASGFSLLANPKTPVGEGGRPRAAEAETEASSAALQEQIDAMARRLAELSGRVAESAANAPAEILEAAPFLETSPEEAARWVAELPEGEEQDRAALVVVDRWSRLNPSDAAAWTTGFAEGTLREEAMYLIARRWGMGDDRGSAANWLETLPMATSRDRAIEAFVMSADGYDIELAAEWANRIEDAESRATLVEGTAQRWLSEDNEAARAWISKAQLPTGLAERLLTVE